MSLLISRCDQNSLTELTCLLSRSPFQASPYLSHEYLTSAMNTEWCSKARHLSRILRVTGNLKITSSVFCLVCIPRCLHEISQLWPYIDKFRSLDQKQSKHFIWLHDIQQQSININVQRWSHTSLKVLLFIFCIEFHAESSKPVNPFIYICYLSSALVITLYASSICLHGQS